MSTSDLPYICQITGKPTEKSEFVLGSSLIHPIQDLIQKDYPAWDPNRYTSSAILNTYRMAYFRDLLNKNSLDASLIEKEVIKSLLDNELLSKNIGYEYLESLSFGERLSDKLTLIGGSWSFIMGFCLFLGLWVVLNTVVLIYHRFDPYPFIFLNLILSCVAALQAPIIMMSQNRQAQKDRTQSEHDYKINLKAEVEIQILNKKMDHLMAHVSEITQLLRP